MWCTFAQQLFYKQGMTFSQIIYEIFECDLIQGFFIHGFNIYFYDDKFLYGGRPQNKFSTRSTAHKPFIA